jgi:hypothetical protein
MPQEILARAPYRYAVGRHALTTLAVGAPPWWHTPSQPEWRER